MLTTPRIIEKERKKASKATHAGEQREIAIHYFCETVRDMAKEQLASRLSDFSPYFMRIFKQECSLVHFYRIGFFEEIL